MLLFINGCVRESSRTYALAKEVLSGTNEEIREIRLYPDGPDGLTGETLKLRDRLLSEKAYDHPMFENARLFASADAIVLAAPYWNLLFPARVLAYLEEVMAGGITFYYGEDERPHGLCRAKRLVYVTTAGGPIFRHYGYEYAQELCRTFFGIPETRLVKAERLDLLGSDENAIMEKAKKEMKGI